MSERASLTIGIVVAMLIALCTIGFSEQVVAQTACPAGTRPAVATDAVVEAHELSVGTCYNPNTVGLNQSAEQAKTYLMSLPRSGTATNNANIEALNNSFAICAANFLKAFTSKYGNVTITAGYRSPATDAVLCKNNPACGALENNPNPMGNHQKGLAMDVSAGNNQNAMDLYAQQNPQFGVCFPFSLGGVTGTGRPDTVHMILAGIPGSEPSGAGCRGVTQACSGSGFNPNNIPPVAAPPGATIAAVPAARVLSATQNPLIASTPLTSTSNPFATNPLVASQPIQACTPQYMCMNNTLTYETSSCTTQVVQMCQYGCSGNSCAAAPAASSTTQQSAASNPIATSPSLTSGTSILPSGQQGQQNGSVITTIATGSATQTPQEFEQQSTFPSSDYSAPAAQSASTLSQILSSLQNILTGLLSYFHSLG